MSETELRLMREKAVAENNWYSQDRRACAFVGADGRLCLVINGAMQYLDTYTEEAKCSAY